jgi:hypothetical protein
MVRASLVRSWRAAWGVGFKCYQDSESGEWIIVKEDNPQRLPYRILIPNGDKLEVWERTPNGIKRSRLWGWSTFFIYDNELLPFGNKFGKDNNE